MRRSRQPFFDNPDTHARIEELASLGDVTVYAGAGASIDRIGLDWGGLINGLLASYVRHENVRRRLLARYGPLQTASIAHEYFREEFGDLANDKMRDQLRVLLYTGRGWSGGKLTDNLARYLVSESNGSIRRIVTTNFDDYIERSLQLPAKAENRAFRRVLMPARISDETSSDATCAYLHGYVPDYARPEDERGTDESDPVLSEDDYLRSALNSRPYLEDAFRQTNVIIVGSSMQDPPLLNALLNSRGKMKRYAIFPLQQWPYSDESERDELTNHLEMRLQHFGVEPIFTDFFGQVSQLFQEVVICARGGRGSYESGTSTRRYGKRLTNWWETWIARDDIVALQASHHETLAAALVRLRDNVLKSRATKEPLKIEVWLRAEPYHRRCLRLWASSVGTWPDVASMREGEVEPDRCDDVARTFVTRKRRGV